MEQCLLSPAGFGTVELIEKRSRFIGRVWPVWSGAEAQRRIAETRAEYHDARHNCWCYIAGGTSRFSDDGEPQGTAGAPMLEVFRREGVTYFCCVVTRYFGGVLLGAGGLARMYVSTAKQALMSAGISEYELFERVKFQCAYGFFEKVKATVTAAGGILEDVTFGADILIVAQIPSAAGQGFIDRLQDLSSGEIAAARIGESIYHLRRK